MAADLIVVIDDDYAMRLSCNKILAKSGYQVELFPDGAKGVEAVAQRGADLVLVDLKMPGMSGMEVIGRIHQIDPQIVIVVITGYATIDTAVEAIKSGAYDFLPKPFSPDELRLIVNRGLERRRLTLVSQRAERERMLLQRRFISFVSHQLQAPLAAVHQYLAVLQDLDDSEQGAAKRQEWLAACQRRTAEMQGIIRDWMTLAKVESEGLSRERVPVDLREMVLDLVAAYEEMAHAESVTLHADLPESSLLVNGDRNCLHILLDNLIVNAIKYNRPGGRVTIGGEVSGGEVVISVADTGIGIPEEYREMIFEEFFRVRGEKAKPTSGTGLGLAICKKIANEMGGGISVESQVGAGSIFRVRLPAYAEKAMAAQMNGSAG